MFEKEEFPKGIDDLLQKLHPMVAKEGTLRVKYLVLRSKGIIDFSLSIILPRNNYIVQRLTE